MSMSEKVYPEVVTFDEAVANFDAAINAEGSDRLSEVSEKKEELKSYLFTNGQDSFWAWVEHYKTVMPLTRTEDVLGDVNTGDDKCTRKVVLQEKLDRLRGSIDAFCEEGQTCNVLLTELSKRYRKRLNDRLEEGLGLGDKESFNLLTELAATIKENRDDLAEKLSRERGRLRNKDFFIAYLLSVFSHVFPGSNISAGDQSLCYNFILLVFQSCAPDHGIPNEDKICVSLESRIKNQKKKELWFEYAEDNDVFVPTLECQKQIDDFPRLTDSA